MNTRRLRLFRGLAWWVAFVVFVIGVGIHENNSPECYREAVPYQSKIVESYKYEKGYKFTQGVGVNGIADVCYRDGKVVSKDITLKPINNIVVIGIKEVAPILKPTYPTNNYFRTGALCNDGSYSTATGRGACSWHGGVSRWLYN